MRRLYVGGLSHTVTQKDLKDRFGKFGDVGDVELRTRRDDEGVPYKTFGYINIEISDVDLKKCMTVLNKSKWKGGTLQIETAKESFLHRLAEERQEAEQQRQQPREAEDKRQKMLDSLSKAGVENFTMKAAVPGTEIPGHKDWVVSKFGRVLPILQLRCQRGSRARTQKYDPSKYSHNIRKLDKTAEDPNTPVTQLTWEIQGGDDDISKKRRGEFPPFEASRPKKSRTDTVNSHDAVGRTRLKPAVHSNTHTEASNGYEPTTNHRPALRREVYAPVSDADSDEEIRRMVAAQSSSHVALGQEADEDNLEVVGFDYLAKTGRSHQLQRDDKEENDYDSADTDELLASKKPPPTQETPTSENHLTGKKTNKKGKMKKKTKKAAEEEEQVSSDAEEPLSSRKQQTKSTQRGKSSQSQSKELTVTSVEDFSPPESDSDEEEDEDDEDEPLESASDSDSDYEAMFSNVTHLEISLADLQRIAEESEQTSETTTPSILSSSSKQGTTPKSVPKKGTTPEEILASIMAEDSSDDEQKKKKKKKRKAVASTLLPAFQGTSVMKEGSETEAEVKKQKLDSEAPQVKLKETEKKTSESSEEERKEEVKNKAAQEEGNSKKAETSSSSNDDEEEEEEEDTKSGPTVPTKAAEKASSSSSSSSSEEDEDEQEIISAPAHQSESSSSSSSSEEEDEDEKPALPHRVPLGAKEEEELQREANVRRLAALQQRQKETEEHKKLIQGALANLDGPAKGGGGGKHIVFGSDDDDDDDDDDEGSDDEKKEQETSGISTSKKTLFQDSQSEDQATDGEQEAANRKGTINVHPKPPVSHLFSGSEDEEEADEGDSSRFDIRPQFEGEAGQKLMELQSRFGADERFRMDSRFLEEEKDKEEESEIKKSVTEDDEALEEERKKNLSILQSVLGSSQQTSSSKTSVKAKTFRDVSALHYDPSKEEHAAFETKTEETKESKAARRKKREEAQKLPEVSKEIYFNVSGDLKAVFGASKPEVTEKEEKPNWDQEEEEEEEEEEKDEQPTLLTSLLSADGSTEKEESSGFKFSFFGDDADTESKQTEEYKAESIQGPKVSWQQDPRFHDSSSEEDEDEQEDEEKTSIAAKTTEEEISSISDRFFFFPEDSRLTEGPRLFCRPSHLEEQREQWEETRTALRQEYRKKHRDARRKLKSSQKI